MINTHIHTYSQTSTFWTGSECAFSKKYEIPSQGVTWQYVPNLVQLCDPYELEGREMRHKVIFRNGYYTQLSSAVVTLATHIQTCSQTSTSTLGSESAFSKECENPSQGPTRQYGPKLVQFSDAQCQKEESFYMKLFRGMCIICHFIQLQY